MTHVTHTYRVIYEYGYSKGGVEGRISVKYLIHLCGVTHPYV